MTVFNCQSIRNSSKIKSLHSSASAYVHSLITRRDSLSSDKLRIFFLNTCLPDLSVFNDFDRLWQDIGGNSGNGYIAWSVAKQLGIDIFNVDSISNIFEATTAELSSATEAIGQKCDAVFLFLQDAMRADNIIENYTELISFIDGIAKPLIVFSLGSNSFDSIKPNQIVDKLDKSCRLFVEAVLMKALSAAVRGHTTAEVIERLGFRNYSVVGCPTWYEGGASRKLLPRHWDDAKGIAATGLFSSRNQEDIYYFLQSEKRIVRSLYDRHIWESDEDMDLNLDYPHYSECIHKSAEKGRIFFFVDPDIWKRQIAAVANIAIGTRVHGSIIAINAGIPAVCTNGDSRAREMCDLFKIPLLPGKNFYDMDVRGIFDKYPYQKINREYVGLYRYYTNWLSSTLSKCYQNI